MQISSFLLILVHEDYKRFSLVMASINSMFTVQIRIRMGHKRTERRCSTGLCSQTDPHLELPLEIELLLVFLIQIAPSTEFKSPYVTICVLVPSLAWVTCDSSFKAGKTAEPPYSSRTMPEHILQTPRNNLRIKLCISDMYTIELWVIS